MRTKDIVYIALFAAITAAIGLFPPFPLPVTGVPITVQSIAPMLAGSILGAKRGFLSQALFLVLAALGLPLFAGGRGGFGVFLGATGGFALGWAVGAFVIGFLTEKFWRELNFIKVLCFNLIGGIGIIYLIGTPWMAFVLKLDLMQAVISSLPFVPGDMIKAVLAAFIGVSVRKSYPIIEKERVL